MFTQVNMCQARHFMNSWDQLERNRYDLLQINNGCHLWILVKKLLRYTLNWQEIKNWILLANLGVNRVEFQLAAETHFDWETCSTSFICILTSLIRIHCMERGANPTQSIIITIASVVSSYANINAHLRQYNKLRVYVRSAAKW